MTQANGKQSPQFTKAQVISWREGAEGFLRWVDDVKPRIPGRQGGPIVFVPEDFQVDAVRRALALKPDGTFKYQTIILSFPRRHSKTTLAALLVLWRFFTKPGENIVYLTNSEKQSRNTGFSLCRGIVQNTPALAAQLPGDCIQTYRLSYPKLGNELRTVSTTISALYGEKLTCGWISELHAAKDDEAMRVLASSLGDSANPWLLIDSTVDKLGGPLHKLEQLAESGKNPTICVIRQEYADLAEALERSPSWICRDWLQYTCYDQTLPAIFASQHLNKRSESSNCLFSATAIAACQKPLPHPLTKSELEQIAAGRAYATGGGLDRAYFASLHGDSTIWTCVSKIADPDGGEAHFYILHQKSILGSLASGIKKAMLHDVEEYGLHNTVIEAYNAQDIALWATDKGIPNEVTHASTNSQVPAFMELYRIVSEGRLHFSEELQELAKEMGTFLYELQAGGTPKFGSRKFHDDRVYSLAWAIYSLRENELAAYELKNLVCQSRSAHAQYCYLRQGDLVLACSRECQAHTEVLQMYAQHCRANVESDVSLPDFFKNRVTLVGASIFQ
ncbi:hypothetical protein [Desulfovibrio cuneatus]|uniref:hypothetical protein n=1 Tax=Desulfovibrio cuneatus TaxID=159728 RepID=UPI0004029FC1|nr:hypothetical protein [Desulfovibrio cuneatus]